MEDLDSLRWAAGFSFRAYGLKIGFRVNRQGLDSQLKALLPPGWSPSEARVVDHLYSLRLGIPAGHPVVGQFHLAYSGSVQVARSLDLEETLESLASDLRLLVAATAKTGVFVHAGVVGWKGRAILIPGRSWSGKSTLTEALVRAGATYYSDEYAILDARGRVHPFATPLSIRPEGPGRARKTPVGEIGGTAGRRALPVGLVISTRYDPQARWRPKTLTAGETALVLLDNTVAARRLGGTTFGVFKRLTSTAIGLRGPRGDATITADAILQSLERQADCVQRTPRRIADVPSTQSSAASRATPKRLHHRGDGR